MKLFFLVITLSCSAIAHAQSIHDLDFLIGKWNLHEVTYPGSPKEYIETGKRQCSYDIMDTYIRCESRAVRKGKERMYVFLIHWLPDRKEFSMISLFSDYPQQGKYRLFLDATKTQLQINAMPGNFDDDSFSHSAINFADKDKLVWEGMFSSFREPAEWKVLYRETATRVK